MTRGEGGRGTRDGWLAYALGLPLAVLTLAPFLYMVVTAVRDQPIETFVAAATTMPFDRFLLTSLVLSLAVASGQVFTSATAAYALARLRFAGRERVLLAYLSALMAPGILLAIPRFLLIDALGWVDRYRGLVSTELVSVTGIFLLRQFFRTIPRDLEDAARLEGAREWTIFWRVILPVSRPALVTLGVLAFADQWRSFLWPLVATRAESMRPVEVGIADLRGLYELSGPGQMAAATLAVLPVVLVYCVARRYFVRGISETGLR